jgi:alpha-glucosidase
MINTHKFLKEIFFVLFLWFVWTIPSSGQDTFSFIGDFKSAEPDSQSVTIQAENGAVNITHIDDVGFQIRYSFDKNFEPIHSYATVDSVLKFIQPKIRKRVGRLLINQGGVRITVQKNPVRLSFSTAGDSAFIQESIGVGHKQAQKTHIINKPEEAVYYGLGEKASGLNRTGRSFTLWNSDTPGYIRGQDPLYKSFPFYIRLHKGKAYGIYYDNSYRSEFDFGGKLKEQVGYSTEGGELRFYVLYGPEITEVIKKYTRLTGRSPLPPKWALGYQQSRWSYYPQKQVYRLADEFRSRKIPLDVLYLDIHYMDGYRVFTWNKERFPAPGKMISDLKAMGIKTVPIVDPGVKKDPGYFVYDEGMNQDLFVTMPGGSVYVGDVWPGRTVFPDFSNPATRNWWGRLYQKLLDDGIAGIWTDMIEPAVFGGKTMPDIAEFDNNGRKTSALEMHNLYGLLMAQTTYESLKELQPDDRPFVITRAAFSGVQRYSSVWTGDNSAKWEDVYLTMPMVMGLGLAGVPFAGFDIGGFNGSPNGEMYTRFLQIGIFMPFSRTHSAAGTESQEPWSYGPRYTAINKKLIELRYRLLPQLYTAFYQHTQNGAPIIRPLFLTNQNDPKTYNINDQFFVGDHLMVAPVYKEGRNDRELYLPEGKWYRMFTNKQFEGEQKISASAPLLPVYAEEKNTGERPLTGIPMFVRAGAVLPMQQVQQYVGEKETQQMELNVYAGGSRESQLYEDAGNGFDYKKGAYQLTIFNTNDSGSELTIDVSRKGSYSKAVDKFNFQIHGISAEPKSVTADGKTVKFDFNQDKSQLIFTTSSEISKVNILKK